MIDLYTWKTPNGQKISIMLEEVQLPYKILPVDLSREEQFKPEFLKISPNNKIPAIVDHDAEGSLSLPIFESGAILIYLAEKSGHLLSKNIPLRMQAIEWLMFQMSAIGPILGQLNHFRRAPEQIPYAIERFTTETKRLLKVVEKRLSEAPYLAGPQYSIADIASYPWLSRYESFALNLKDYPNMKRWLDELSTRPAVSKGMKIPNV